MVVRVVALVEDLGMDLGVDSEVEMEVERAGERVEDSEANFSEAGEVKEVEEEEGRVRPRSI